MRMLVLAILLLLAPQALAQAPEVYLFPKPQSDDDQRELYPLKLLDMALWETRKEYGAYRIVYTENSMSRARSFEEIKKGRQLHVRPAATKPHWEKELLPIRIPLMRGLVGTGVMLIRKSDQALYSKMKTVKELKALKLGLGMGWSNTPIYERLGFEVIKGDSYEGLFRMLIRKRFDYFIRGAVEIVAEHEKRAPTMPELHIEESKVILLPLPIYFFVSPNQPLLAERLEKGLKILMRNGEFDKLFNKTYLPTISKLNLKKRKVFRLKNPGLSKESEEAMRLYGYKFK